MGHYVCMHLVHIVLYNIVNVHDGNILSQDIFNFLSLSGHH